MRSYDRTSVLGPVVVVVVAGTVVVVGVLGTVVPMGSGASEAGAGVVVVAGDDVVVTLDPSVVVGVDGSGWTGSATSCSVLLMAIVVGGSIAVGVSVTWSRTLLTAADAMSTAATVTASQISG